MNGQLACIIFAAMDQRTQYGTATTPLPIIMEERVVIGLMMHQSFVYVSACITLLMVHYDHYLADTAYDNCTNGDVRLVGGRTEHEGNVQFCSNNTWSSVCHLGDWSTIEASVVCRQLHYDTSGKKEREGRAGGMKERKKHGDE